MRVGILTITGNHNFGNRLQNFALQEIIRSLGHIAESIRNYPQPSRGFSKNDVRAMALVNSSGGEYFGRKLVELRSRPDASARDARMERITAFTAQHIAESGFEIRNAVIPAGLDASYDLFVVGSDQVWNPMHMYADSFGFLDFTEPKKRVAYAASFGVSSIPRKLQSNYTKGLSGIPQLSVRESSGARLVKLLTDRDVPVTLDPTLLLSRERWSAVSKPSSYKPNRPYVLTFFLQPPTRKMLAEVDEVASHGGLEVVHLGYPVHCRYFVAGPEHFLDYVASASLVCTDSFHATVFSVLFERNFVVFDRGLMTSRIQDLLSLLDMTGHRYKGDLIAAKNATDGFGLSVRARDELEAVRSESMQFLNGALV